MSWGGLNPALTAWRNGINQRFPGRGRASDGGYADKAHGSASQHQPDPDGTVDAFDMDVNLLGSDTPSGTRQELALVEALKADFEDNLDRGQLWIHNSEIANAEVDDWRVRDYDGDNPHTLHVHWQSRQGRERDGRQWSFRRTDALLARMRGDLPVDATAQQELANRIAKAIMDAPVMVNGVPWKYGTAIGYLARKAYEVDGTLDRAADALAEHVFDADQAVTPTANTSPDDPSGR